MGLRDRPSAQYEITMRLAYPHEPGWIAKIAGLIAQGGGAIRAIDLVQIHQGQSLRDYSIECPSTEHATRSCGACGSWKASPFTPSPTTPF